MGMKLKTVIESSPFIRMQNEQQYWTGYDANLIDEAIKRGTELEQENRRFREFSPRETRKAFWNSWGIFGGIFVALAICGGAAIGIAAAIHTDKYGEGYAVGAQDATIAAITFVESQYRHVSPMQIRLELPYGTEIFNKVKWFETHIGTSNLIQQNIQEYDEMMIRPYRVFITPADEVDNKK